MGFPLTLALSPGERGKFQGMFGIRSGSGFRQADAGSAQPAIAIRILRQVLLVIGLCIVERGGIDDLGRNPGQPLFRQLCLIQRQAFLCGLALLVRVDVDARAVLGADVVALAHPLGRVV